MNSHLQLVDDHYFDEEPDLETRAPPVGGFVPLGLEKDKVVVFSHLQKSVVKFRPSDLKESVMRVFLGSLWYDFYILVLERQQQPIANRRSKAESGASMMAKHIIASCQAVGIYLPSTERRAGAWLDEKGGLVINSGALWRHDGAVLSHGIHGDYVYPVVKSLGFGPDTSAATSQEVQRVLEVFRTYNWQVPFAAELVLGWVGVCLTATALRRRPHVLITGPAGCGKSTLLEQVTALLGRNAAPVTGSPTLMGLQQLVQDHPSRGIVIDEFEHDGRNQRRMDVFEAARASYSLQEGDAGVVRGSTTGEARAYKLSSPFMGCGISPGPMEPADVTRWVLLELAKLPPQEANCILPSRDEFEQLGPSLARLLISRWTVLRDSLEKFRAAVQVNGGDARMGDTYGHLLACYWAFVNERVATASDAERIIEDAAITKRLHSQAASDHEECLNALFTRVVAFDMPGGASKLSIGEACHCLVKGSHGKRSIEERFSQMGLRVRTSKGRQYLLVANSPSHSELRRVFAGSKWSHGGWGLVLRRLPGGCESTQRLGPGLPPCKVTAFLLPDEMQSEASSESP